MKLGLYNAILHDRTLPAAVAVIAELGRIEGIDVAAKVLKAADAALQDSLAVH